MTTRTVPESQSYDDGNSSDSSSGKVPSKRRRINESCSSISISPSNTQTNNKSINTDPIFYIPSIVLARIFEFLPETHRLQECQYVNKHWHHVINKSSSCWKKKVFKLERLVSVSTSPHQYNYMYNFLKRFGGYLKSLTITINGRSISRPQTLQLVEKMDALLAEGQVFYRLKKLNFSCLRLDRYAWNDKREEQSLLFLNFLQYHVPTTLKILEIHDLLMEQKYMVRLFNILDEKFQNLEELDMEELLTYRRPDSPLVQVVIPPPAQFIEREDGEIIETPPPAPPREIVTQDTNSSVDYRVEIPMMLARYLSKTINLRMLVINYEYLTKSMFEVLLRKDSKFARHLRDFHLRVDRPRNSFGFNQINNEPDIGFSEVSHAEFSALTAIRPRVRFSISFEREMKYDKHCKILGAIGSPKTFRLHRLELRGDAFADHSAQDATLSQTVLNVVPRFTESLQKFILDWYNPMEYLDAELIKVVKECKNLRVMKLKLFMSFTTVTNILNLIRFCAPDLDSEEIMDFDDFPQCIPTDMDKLPRKLDVLKVSRYCFSPDEPEDEEDLEWQDFIDQDYINNEYRIAIDRLQIFDYERTIAY